MGRDPVGIIILSCYPCHINAHTTLTVECFQVHFGYLTYDLSSINIYYKQTQADPPINTAILQA